jgi:hypothetical protein
MTSSTNTAARRTDRNHELGHLLFRYLPVEIRQHQLLARRSVDLKGRPALCSG